MAIAARRVVLRRKPPAELGIDAEHPQIIGTDFGAANPDRLTFSGQVGVDHVDCGNGLKLGRMILPVHEDATRGLRAPPGFRRLPDLYDPVGIRVGQGFEKQSIDNTEDRGIGADAQRKRKNGHSDKAGRLGELPEGKPEVGEH